MKDIKWSRTLKNIAFLNCALLLMIGSYFMGLGEGLAIFAAILYPIYILIMTLVVIILSIINRKVWFDRDHLYGSLILLLVCSPLPLVLVMYLS